MRKLIKFMQGILIGVGAIAPGVSGGTIAVTFGLYNEIIGLVASIGENFSDFKKKFKNIWPVILGMGVGLFLFAIALKSMFEKFETETVFLFLGLMTGTIPFMLKKSKEIKTKNSNLIFFLVSFFITILPVIIKTDLNISDAENSITKFNLYILIFYGFVLALGSVIPGISSSLIFMYLGAYKSLLSSFVAMDMKILLPIALGFILSVVFLTKIINFLFKKFKSEMYFLIFGFVLGSISVIFMNNYLNLKISCILIFIIGIIISYNFEKIKP